MTSDTTNILKYISHEIVKMPEMYDKLMPYIPFMSAQHTFGQFEKMVRHSHSDQEIAKIFIIFYAIDKENIYSDVFSLQFVELFDKEDINRMQRYTQPYAKECELLNDIDKYYKRIKYLSHNSHGKHLQALKDAINMQPIDTNLNQFIKWFNSIRVVNTPDKTISNTANNQIYQPFSGLYKGKREIPQNRTLSLIRTVLSDPQKYLSNEFHQYFNSQITKRQLLFPYVKTYYERLMAKYKAILPIDDYIILKQLHIFLLKPTQEDIAQGDAVNGIKQDIQPNSLDQDAIDITPKVESDSKLTVQGTSIKTIRKKNESTNKAEGITIDPLFIEGNIAIRKPKQRRQIIASKRNYLAEAQQNILTGDKGEDIVIIAEKNRLLKEGADQNLIAKIHRVSITSDSYGYDILSCNIDGSLRYIEVKTTSQQPSNFSFELTINEIEKARILKNNYYIYIVFNVNSKCPKIKVVKNPFGPESCLELTPIKFRADLKITE